MKRKFLTCSSLVNPDAVKHVAIDGIEHIIVSSFTMPSDIVMNGVMYPGDEIQRSFEGLNRTLAPVEHPSDEDGQFISANDPVAIHKFHAGAYNDNAELVGNRVKVDKVINVQEARKSERGKRLLDRIDELENSSDPRPIHTSTGVFLEIEELSEPQTNSDGQTYSLVAHNMVFDHDAILLDSVGAAQPHQGVGMAVNSAGQQMETISINLDAKEGDDRPVDRIDFGQLWPNLSYKNILDQLRSQAVESINHEWLYIDDLDDTRFIFETDRGFFEAPYRVDNDTARMTGLPVAVDRVISYQPKTNAKGDIMKEMIINALKAVGKFDEKMSDDELLEAYNALMTKANESEPEDDEEGDDIAEVVGNALKPLEKRIEDLQAKLNAKDDDAKGELIKTITNSDKYPGLDDDHLKAMPLDTLKKMAANCGSGHGLPLNINFEQQSDALKAPVEMPE